MNAEVAREEADRDFESKKEAMRKRDEERTRKNQKRRERNKKKKGQRGKAKGDVEMEDEDEDEKMTKDVTSPAVLLENDNKLVGDVKEEVMVTIYDEN